jgi:hypothetical protein
MTLCVNAKQHIQAQVEAIYNISILCDIYALSAKLTSAGRDNFTGKLC